MNVAPCRRRRRRLVTTIGALLLGPATATVVASCGIGDTSSVEEIDRADLAQLDPEPETTVSAADTAPGSSPDNFTGSAPRPGSTRPTNPAFTTTEVTVTVSLYFVDGARLAPVGVVVPEGASLRRLLRALEEDLPPEARAAGIRSVIPPGAVAGLQRRGAEVTVDLDAETFAGVPVADQALMVGQIVLTLTDRSGIS
ncbi:hypothetical protein BH24ACT5_BH24ACT5_26060 [soil metagenome]